MPPAPRAGTPYPFGLHSLLLRDSEGDTPSSGSRSKRPSPISDYSNSTHSQSSSE
ncbi:hypothetical protein SERLA73DRAFT_81022 [Serpula lacrymans var. lacrymans S7.3]|uniref:Uncharacterized protein n=1 Tax=Serpula lacrymans var. lacrymans (strain S7.3) TaxID=936435 RepID=F8QKM0_SERL3|nr:hypothetical protein SERLA73DRAFT_81022 [Serpula lacrymans var. lacrymans S7.3]